MTKDDARLLMCFLNNQRSMIFATSSQLCCETFRQHYQLAVVGGQTKRFFLTMFMFSLSVSCHLRDNMKCLNNYWLQSKIELFDVLLITETAMQLINAKRLEKVYYVHKQFY